MNDTDLWGLLCSGEKNALKTVYEKFAEDVLQYGYKLCKDRSIVEDALQEIFINCWEKRETLPEVYNIKSYLFTAVRRKIYRKLAYTPQWSSIHEEDAVLFNSEVQVDGEAFQNVEEMKELSARVRKMVSQLSKRQKEIVYLKYFEGMDYEEIEKIMGLKYQSSRNLLSKALKNLRNL